MRSRSVADRLSRARAPRTILGACAGFLAAVGFAFAQGATPPAPASTSRAPAADPVVARVGAEAIRMSEIGALQKRNIERYTKETGRPVPEGYDSFFLRAGLEEAIRMRLVTLDARARGMTASNAAAESLMMQDAFFRPNGKFDRARFDAYRRENPKGFADARTQASDMLVYQRRMRELERQFDPDAATLDRLVAGRTTTAQMRYVLVSDITFDGKTDPTDEELRAYYQREKQSLARPGELSYTVISVPYASATESAQNAARARGAEVLAAARTPAAFDSLARLDGVVASSGVWREGQGGEPFASNAALAREALALAPGAVLPRLIESAQGVAILRADRIQAPKVPTLSDVATDLRARWRSEKLEAENAGASRQYYDTHPDSFFARAWSVRWAIVDSTRLKVRAPKDEELLAWFESHKAEFARLDPAGGGIQMRTFEEVRPLAEARWRDLERARLSRELADNLAVAWARNKNGDSNEAIRAGGPTWIVEGGAMPPDLPRALADSARSWSQSPRAVVVPDPAGYGVVALARYEPRYKAPYEVVAPRARELALSTRLATGRAGGRAWFEQHRDRFRTGPGYAIAYGLVTFPPLPQVDVSAAQLEAYYQSHLADFTTPGEVRVSHVLIGTANRNEADARALAQQILTRAKGGEDFGALARQYSEDPGSKDKGGDLGFMRRGQTVPAFDRAVFTLSAARPYSGLVQTEFGFHVVKYIDKKDGKTTPFTDVRDEIGRIVAQQLADSLARRSADAFRRSIRGREDMLHRADSLKIATALTQWYEGDALNGPAIVDALREDVMRARPGTVLPRVYPYMKSGYVVAHLDTLLAPRDQPYEEVEDKVLAEMQREAQVAAARARADRLARELTAGSPWPEAVETIGGEVETRLLARGEPLPTIGPLPELDALIYGPGADTLGVGKWTRLTVPRGDLFVLLVARNLPDDVSLATARAAARQTVLNRRMYDYVEDLRQKHTVTVLRSDLAERLPAPPTL